jgi:hypothetical protein
MRIMGPVTNALHPSFTARSNAATISSMLYRVGTNTNCGGAPRATRRSIAPTAAAKLEPGRTRSCVAAVAPSTEIWMQSTSSAPGDRQRPRRCDCRRSRS